MTDIDFSFSEVCRENIAELSRRQSVAAEQKIAELSMAANEAASLILERLEKGEKLSSLLSGHLFNIELSSLPHVGHLPDDSQALTAMLSSLSCHDRIEFVFLLAKRLEDRGICIAESELLSVAERDGSVAFVKNPLSSEAFDVFSQQLYEPRLRYTKDMREAVSLLVSDEVGYCILPLEERGGRRILATEELILRENLKIASVTPVFGALGGADMSYALVSTTVHVPTCQLGDDRYLEIMIELEDEHRLSELFIIAERLNLRVHRINNLRFDTEEGSTSCLSMVFLNERGDFSLLLAYLTFFVRGFKAVGIYKNIE